MQVKALRLSSECVLKAVVARINRGTVPQVGGD